MKSKVYTYEGEQVTVRYDVKRCIHAKECVSGLPQVF
ncbi:MAG: (4Fe-4S)-binding protein, partial [Bacteroidetes bacterium]|nr:(4Fe-4S)-binding protein [Bacteroidota bacterium]